MNSLPYEIDAYNPWLVEGYKLFSEKGIQGLKIEVMANNLNKSRSSFYHAFLDLEIYVDSFLDSHIKRGELLSQLLDNCQKLDPEIIELFIIYKQDILFNKQLFLDSGNKKFMIVGNIVNTNILTHLLPHFAKYLLLENQSAVAKYFLNFKKINFYLL